MTCYKPLRGWRARHPNPSGAYSIVYNRKYGFEDLPMAVPCGRCIGCRLDRSRQWAIRCGHEAKLHARNSFLTLTYRSSDLPADGSVSVDEMQRFLKRLRKAYGAGLRVFYCGEYGEERGRPHYHVCLFGEDFCDDRQPLTKSHCRKYVLYHSPSLTDIWGKGYVAIGALTFESAAYTARYILKKVTGDPAEQHYCRVDPLTGEVTMLTPEFAHQSRSHGLGYDWFMKFKDDVYPSDQVIVRGKAMRPPAYYDDLLAEIDPAMWQSVRNARIRERRNNPNIELDNTDERLNVRMRVKEAQLQQLVRGLEHDA